MCPHALLSQARSHLLWVHMHAHFKFILVSVTIYVTWVPGILDTQTLTKYLMISYKISFNANGCLVMSHT